MRASLTQLLSVGLATGGLACTIGADRDANGWPDDASGLPGLDAAEGYTYRIDVAPSGPTDGTAALLGASLFVPTDDAQDLTLRVRRPVSVRGTVTAFVPSPTLATVPGVIAPVDAEVSLRLPGTVQSRFGRTDEAGSFDMSVVPDATYELVVRPATPEVPFSAEAIDVVRDVDLDLFFDLGRAVWGQVVDARGAPLAGVTVAAVNASGVGGHPDLTDADGRFLVRVLPGTYVLVAAGRASGRDPVVQSPLFAVGEDNVRQDIVYGPLELVTVGGRLTAAGAAVRDARVRFTAEQLDGYAESATHAVEAVANSSGAFDTRLVPGTYAIEVLPAADAPVSPLLMPGVRVDADLDLGAVALAPHLTVSARAREAGGGGLAGTSIRCTELVGEERTFATVADPTGAWSLALPQVEVECAGAPPGDRPDLALERVAWTPGADPTPNLVLGRGVPVNGRVLVGSSSPEPLAFALVQVRDGKGSVWGSAITDGDGGFSVRVAWPAAADDGEP